jgi:protein TonB
MRVTMCAAFVIGSLVAVPVAAQTPPTTPPAPQTPETETVRGPLLGSPEIVELGPGVKSPRLMKEVKPTYPKDVMNAGIQGMVTVDAVVLTDGTVGDVKVTKSLHAEIDREAIRTVRKWLFRPATREGEPVPVKVEIEMQFTLRAGPK